MERKAQYCPAARMWFLPFVLLRRLVPNGNLNTAEPKKTPPAPTAALRVQAAFI